MEAKLAVENFTIEKFNTIDYVGNLNLAKDMIMRYFFPLQNGSYGFLYDGNIMLYDHKTINNVFFKRMPKVIQKWFFTEYEKIFVPVSNLRMPRFYDNKINLSPQLPSFPSYETFAEEDKETLNVFLSYIKEVIANNNEEVYDYVLKWCANMTRGNKNQSALILKK